MSQVAPSSEVKPKNKVLRVIVFLLLAAGIFLIINNNLHRQGYQWFLGIIGEQQKSTQMVTYYQWSDHNGKIQVSRELPNNSVKYISFQASEDLQQTTNKVDSNVIARSESYRQQVFAGGSDGQNSESSRPTGGAESRGPAGLLNCVRVKTRMATLKQEIRTQTTASDKRKYQTELAKLESKGC